VSQILQLLSDLWSPFGNIFHYLFYLPIFNILILLYEGVQHVPLINSISYAVAIFLLTVLIRLALFPLTRKQLQSSRAMQVLQPQLQELQRRYGRDNPRELMAAQQALYREHGVNPYTGCFPLLIQMPFLYGLYFSLYTVLLSQKHGKVTETVTEHLKRVNHDLYGFVPHLLHLPATTFFWTNLATPDPWKILPILAGIFTFIQLRMAQPVRRPTPAGQRPDPNAQAMSSMQFIMPFFTFFIGLNFPSGLALYWTISTIFSGVQQYFLTGLGSLFVGIPGLEHLVPEPQPLPTLPTSASRGGSPLTVTRVVEDTAPQRPSGLAGFGALLRQLTAPRETPPDGAASAIDGTGASDKADRIKANGTGKGEKEQSPLVVTPREGTNGSAPTPRRPRVDRLGPMLVNPASSSPGEPAPTASPNPTGERQSSASNGAARPDTSGPARTPSGSATPTSGRAAGAGNPGGAKRTSGASESGGTPRRTAGGTSNRGGSASRRRSGGRPKGGR
jgi:YidC/Oxa1 family membrane protein insertase